MEVTLQALARLCSGAILACPTLSSRCFEPLTTDYSRRCFSPSWRAKHPRYSHHRAPPKHQRSTRPSSTKLSKKPWPNNRVAPVQRLGPPSGPARPVLLQGRQPVAKVWGPPVRSPTSQTGEKKKRAPHPRPPPPPAPPPRAVSLQASSCRSSSWAPFSLEGSPSSSSATPAA